VELSTVAEELYGLPLKEFTAARNARASEERRTGDRELADLVQRLRKPSTGAWVVNRLVREQPQEIESLIELGTTLRSERNLDGARIRQTTKGKGEIVVKLVQRAKALAQRAGVPFSQAIETEVAGTLDAAFSDSGSAQSLREGCLTAGLHYSGLGFGTEAGRQAGSTPSRKAARGTGLRTYAESKEAKDDLQQARSEAKRADSEVAKGLRAVKTAEADLQRLRAALTVAQRQATKAHEKAASAQKRVERLRG
jgi:septal ring factor EnvC (AmiA/AmiB activator)